MTICRAIVNGELKTIVVFGEIKYEEKECDPNKLIFKRKKREELDVKEDIHLQA